MSGKRTTFRPAGFVVPPRCLNHCWSVSGANVGHLPLLRHPGGELEGLRERRRVRDEVDEPGRPRREPGDLVDQPERVGVARAEPVLPAVVEELRLVGGHVDVDRAVVRAALAREAEVERLHHLVRLPAVGDDLAFEHLEQETRAAAGRVHLLARRHEGRAHDVDPVGRAALADADTADGRVREVAVVARVAELDLRPPRLVVGAEAEVLVDAVRPDDLARVHLPVGVPDRLELLEGADEVVAEHLRQELRARLAVAVLARQRAAELEHEVARVLEPAPELRDPGLRDQVEVPAGVDAALAVVAVERALVAVALRELREAAEVLAEPLGRDGRVLPALVRVLLARDERRRAEPRLAHLPDVLLAVGVVVQLHPRRRLPVLLEVAHQRARLRVGLVLRLAAELDEQPAAAVGEHRALVLVDAEQRHVLDQRVVHPLDRDRLVLARDRDVVGGAELVRVADGEERDARRLRDQLERRLEDRHARRLRADERARDLEPLLREQLVEVVARDAARDLRIAGADLVRVRVGERAQPLGDRVRHALAAAPDAQPLAAVGQHLELHEVVRDARPGTVELRLHRVPAARVVAEHAAERAVGVRGRVRPEGQSVLLARGVAQVVEDAARLHARDAALGVDLEDVVEVLREVDQHRRVAALAGEARAPAAQDDRRPVLAADAVDLDELVHVARDDDADRRHPVVRGVGRVEGAAAGVEADLALDRGAQLGGEAPAVDLVAWTAPPWKRVSARLRSWCSACHLRELHAEASGVTVLELEPVARAASGRAAGRRPPARGRRRRASPRPGRGRGSTRGAAAARRRRRHASRSRARSGRRRRSSARSRGRRRERRPVIPPQRVTSAWRQSTQPTRFAEVGRDVGVLAGRDLQPGRPASRIRRKPSRSSEETGSSNQRHVPRSA